MRVDRLRCASFRNIEELVIEPHEGMNVICGENAQGKTNIIEALWLFTGAKSFRGTKDSSFIKFGEQRAKSELDFIFEGSVTEVRRQIGNAVPPVGVQAVAKRLLPLFIGDYEAVDLVPEYEKMKAMTVKQRLEYVTSQMH